ncbi:MAG: flagellar protein FlgN [Firmicutes bacterium]|nr:flagellar protein FlgN [Bacillota bacterium]
MGHACDGTDAGIGPEVTLPVRLIDDLIELLNEEHSRVVQLLDEAECKKEALLADDLDALERAVAQETVYLEQFEEQEKRRLELMVDIQKELQAMGIEGDTNSSYSLEDVARFAPKSRRRALLTQGQRLKDELLALQEVNILNADLLRHSITLANYSISLLTGDTGQTIYGQPGKTEKSSYQQGRLDARA